MHLTPGMILEVTEPLSAAETLLDELSDNADLRRRFVDSPAEVLQDFALITTANATELTATSILFLTIISNNELVAWVREHEPRVPMSMFAAGTLGKWARSGGPLKLPASHVTATVEAILDSEGFLRDLVGRLAADPAIAAALPMGVGGHELDEWVTQLMEGVREGRRFAELRAGLDGPHGADPRMPFVIVIIVVVIALLAVMVGVDGHDGFMVAVPDHLRDYERLRNLHELSEQLMATRP
jgi:hypothetical protein